LAIHQVTVDEALASLRTTRDGLSEAEAEQRRLDFGPNRVEAVRGRPLSIRFLGAFTHLFALILWAAAGLALAAEWYDPGSGMATLGVAIVGVILLNGLFSFWQEYRAEQALAALQKLLPHEVEALRDGNLKQISAADVVPGDVILLDDGDDIPADCRVIQAFGVRVNSATITGESLPETKDERPCDVDDPIRSRNLLLAGTAVVAGQVKAVVYATGMRTEFGRIAHLSQHTAEVRSPLQKEIAFLSRLIALFSCAVGFVFFWIGRAVGLSLWENFVFAIGILVANVPEGLLPTVTLSLALASQRMARRSALVRHLPSVETLGSATVICTDKTGTLTQNRMVATKMFALGYSSEPEPIDREPTDADDVHNLFEVALHCHTLRESGAGPGMTALGDPMEIALVETARAILPTAESRLRIDEIPFDSDRRMLSVLCRASDDPILYVKGAVEAVLPLCQRAGSGAGARPLCEEDRASLLKAQDAMAEEGLRVLAFAIRRVPPGGERAHLEEDLTFCGLIGLLDPPRPEVTAAIRKCRQAGIKVIMVTGDHPRTAWAVARQIGLAGANRSAVISGDQLRRLSNTQLQIALDEDEVLFARVSADQKLRIVEALQAKRHVVAVTGDGVNDAPALRKADIGIAMGQSGTDVARAAADLILVDDNFASIVDAIEEGRAVFANIRRFLTYILTHNVAELVPYLAFVLARIPLPLGIMQILAIDLGTDTLPALALGAERPEPGVMERPPRPRSERLLDWTTFVRAYLWLGPIEAALCMAGYFAAYWLAGWRLGMPLEQFSSVYVLATTMTLCGIVSCQLGNALACRSDRESIVRLGVVTNKFLSAGIAVEVLILLGLIYTPALAGVFHLAPLDGVHWLVLAPFGLILLASEESRKWIIRCRGRSH
jgi:calcium-translocating P-type ATPase